MSKVIVFASFIPKDGGDAGVEEILKGMVKPTRSEPGCEVYDLFRSTEEPLTYHLFEVYRDRAALEAHRETPHYKAYRSKVPDLLAEPIGVKVLENV